MSKWTVYLLCNKNSDFGSDVYLGSTSKPLAQRLRLHKNDCLRIGYEENKLYKRMREVGFENWIIRQLLSLESTMCTRNDIRKFEKMWCEILNADLNTNSPITTTEEKREHDVAYSAAYRKENKEEISRKKAEYYRKNRNSKKFFCELCQKSFSTNQKLKKHFNSLAHQYAFLNSLD